jgi:hypothetical protein
MALSNEQLQQKADILTDIEETNARIAKQNELAATASGIELDELKSRIQSEKIRLRLLQDEVKPLNDQAKAEALAEKASKERSKAYRDSAKSLARLAPDVKKMLKDSVTGNSLVVASNRKIIELKAQELNLTDDELEAAQEKRAILENLQSSLITQAKATAQAERSARGMTDAAQRRLEFQTSITDLSRDERELAEDLFEQNELLIQQEGRINELKEAQDGIVGALPAGLQSIIGMAKKLKMALQAGLGPIFVIGAVIALAIKSFVDLDDAAGDFRKETGLLNSQMEGIKSQALQISTEFANIGLGSADVLKTVSSLKSEFSDAVDFSKETVAALSVMNKNFGIAEENSAKVQSIFESVGGLSAETAANVQMQAAQMARLAGVAPDKVFKDIAENAEAASTFFKGDLTALTKNAVQARRMGTSLKEQVSLAEKLLDFESGIEEELVAATFVGGQFNLSRARALAYEGKLQEANEETLSQLQRSGDFRKKDFFTQKQLAKAAGMTVEEINKQLNTQDKLNSLSAEQKKAAQDAIDKGLDITNIGADQLAQETEKFAKQQEQQKQLEKITNAFMGMATVIGNTLMPLIEGIGVILMPIQMAVEGIQNLFGGIGEKISGLLGPLGMVGKIIKGVAGGLVVWAALATYAGMATFLASTIVGAPLIPFIAGAASAAVLAAGFGMLSKIGDLNSPANGKTQVSTKEGGLFELSPNDDLVAAPGAAAALANGGAKQTAVGATQSAAPQINLSALSAPLNAMINEIKALRADMASGKISVHMDGEKVSSGINKQSDKTTRNNYAMG